MVKKAALGKWSMKSLKKARISGSNKGIRQ
jgi:hypothetical protein